MLIKYCYCYVKTCLADAINQVVVEPNNNKPRYIKGTKGDVFIKGVHRERQQVPYLKWS